MRQARKPAAMAALITAAWLVPGMSGAAAQSQSQTQAVVVRPAVPPGYLYTEPMAYPGSGQGAAQQTTDRGECHTFAAQNNGGFDPRNPYATIPAPAPQQQAAQQEQGPDGSAVRGAARGAAAGALIGWAAGSPGTGAAVGAASGAVFGRAGSRRQKEAEQQAAQQQAAAAERASMNAFMQLVGRYDDGFKLCMKARGYVVD